MSQPSSRPLLELSREARGRCFTTRFATPLSHPEGAAPVGFSRKSALARLSLLGALAVFSLSGCIVADPPQYEDPGRTPLFLNLALATPRVLEVQVVDLSDNSSANDKFSVSVPVRSDDQGEDFYAALHLDYSYPGFGIRPDKKRFKASTLSDLSRKIELTLTLPSTLRGGCHQATLLAAHESNWDIGPDEPLATAKDDTATATWWLNVIVAGDADPYTLTDCPNRNEVERGN